jgi:hypothetical protein
MDLCSDKTVRGLVEPAQPLPLTHRNCEAQENEMISLLYKSNWNFLKCLRTQRLQTESRLLGEEDPPMSHLMAFGSNQGT